MDPRKLNNTKGEHVSDLESGGSGDANIKSDTIEEKNKAMENEGENNGPKEDDVFEMKEFFMMVKDIRVYIEKVRKGTSTLKKIHAQTLQGGKDDTSEESKELHVLMKDISGSFHHIRKSLKIMSTKNAQLSAGYPLDPNVRIRKAQYSQLVNSFIETRKENQELQVRMKQKYKNVLVKQYKIIKPDVNEDEINRYLENTDIDTKTGVGEQQMLMNNIFTMNNADPSIITIQKIQAQQALEEAISKHADIKNIEKSITELNEIILELSTLVHDQGEMVSQIEDHVDRAVEYTEKAAAEMKSAVHHQKSRRKKKFFLLLIILVVVIIGAVLIYVLAFKN